MSFLCVVFHRHILVNSIPSPLTLNTVGPKHKYPINTIIMSSFVQIFKSLSHQSILLLAYVCFVFNKNKFQITNKVGLPVSFEVFKLRMLQASCAPFKCVYLRIMIIEEFGHLALTTLPRQRSLVCKWLGYKKHRRRHVRLRIALKKHRFYAAPRWSLCIAPLLSVCLTGAFL